MESKIVLEVYNPSGTTELTGKHAPRLDTLNGKIICELSNGLWEHERILPEASKLLKEKFPDVKIIPFSELPVGTFNIDVDNIGEVVKSKGCDGAIVASAA